MALRLLRRGIVTQPGAKHQQQQLLEQLPKNIAQELENLVDPFQLLAKELKHLKQNLKLLIGSKNHTLDSIAKYYFSAPHQGKLLRPLVVLLISQASALHHHHDRKQLDFAHINRSISRLDVLNDTNPTQSNLIDPSSSSSSSSPSSSITSITPQTGILPTQRRLAEIAELIHVSSLLHDDVIDEAELRRGQLSAPRMFGSKLSVLAGDFLLSRASVALSRLGNFEVIELISSVISNLVEGELIQLESILKPTSGSRNGDDDGSKLENNQNGNDLVRMGHFDDRLFDFYQRKNYLKTASLIAKTCRATILLSNPPKDSILIESSYRFGQHFGLAFQIVDDILDYTSTEESMGKTGSLSDLKSGLITAPGLFAWQNCGASFGDLVFRKFSNPGDLDLAQKMIKNSNGIDKSYQLAKHHLQICTDELNHFHDSDSKNGLIQLCSLVLDRKS